MKINYPFRLAIDPTGNCDYNCKYCQYKDSGIKGMELSLEEINSALDDMKELEMNNVHLSGGGEPLVHPRIKDIIRAIGNHDYTLSLITTSYHLDDELFDLLTKAPNWLDSRKGARYVGLSFWGPDPKTYSELQGVPESYFDIVAKNLKRLGSSKVTTTGCFTIVPENHDLIYDTFKFFSESGVDRIYMRKAFTPLKEDLFSKKQMETIREQTEKADEELDIPIGPLCPLYGYEFDYSKPANIKYCKYLLNTINLSCDGKVYPCCGLRYEPYAVVGDIREKSFKRIMEEDWIPFIKNFTCKTHFCTLPPTNPEERVNKELEEELEND